MQCLYCEEELKTFRGLFDEDFCCRDHREKYLSSFRKAMNRFPETPFFQPAEEPEPQAAPLAVEEPVPSATFEEQVRVVIAAAEAPVPAGTFEPQTTPLAPEELVASATSEEQVRVVIAAAEGPVPTADENTVYDPEMADFLPIAVAPVTTADSYRTATPDAFSVCRAIEIPRRESLWNAALEIEERLAEILEPAQIVPVAAFGATPAPLQTAPAHVPAAMDAGSATVCLETAGVAVSGEDNIASGYASLWSHVDPVPPVAMELSVPSLYASAVVAALPPEEQPAEVILFCEELVSTPTLACEIALAHECHLPAFAPPREAMESDEHRAPVPGGAEIAPAMVRTSTPTDRPALLPGYSSEMMPLSLEMASAPAAPASERFNAPALASPVEGAPNLAAGMVSDIPQGDAANSAAVPHSHAPLRASFGSLVRIKNWRLRITFAKPA